MSDQLHEAVSKLVEKLNKSAVYYKDLSELAQERTGYERGFLAGKSTAKEHIADELAALLAPHPAIQPSPLPDTQAEPHVGWIAGHCSDPMNCPACAKEWAASTTRTEPGRATCNDLEEGL